MRKKKKEETIDANAPMDLSPEASKGEEAGKNKKAKPPKVARQQDKVPVLVELVISFSGLFTILMVVIVGLISFSTGAGIQEILMRTVATLISLGGILALVSWKVANEALEATRKSLEEAQHSPSNNAADSNDTNQGIHTAV